MKICLSVGHSEKEQGAVNQTYGVTEFQFNSALAPLIKEQLHKLGHEVVLVWRESLKDLPKKINATGADVAVELHCNAFNKIASGTEVLHYPSSKRGAKLAQFIQDSLVDILDLRDRGVKPSERELILRATSMPCVILEPGFIDNDVDYLLMKNHKEELALAIASGIHEYSLTLR